ncbi:ribonuclease Y [Candidatus Kapabacteria bacterium]|nr:ribonuclease Y [Candidatus Kapabacteria bacterium]
MDQNSIIISIVGAVIGFAVTYFIGNSVSKRNILESELKAKSIVVDAEKEGENIKKEKVREAKDEWYQKKQNFESDVRSKKTKLDVQEKEIKAREGNIEKKLQTILSKEKNLHNFESDLKRKQDEIDENYNKSKDLFDEQLRKLEDVAQLTREEAKSQLIEELENDAKKDAAERVKKIRQESKEKAAREAQNIIVASIQRTASDHAMESTISTVDLESDEMKGRIIGKEGRNIRAFESATGIDLIIDDTPDAVLISGFDPFRREVAKRSLEQLMIDGRIHPTRIEEVVEKMTKELNDDMVKEGEDTCMKLDIHNIHPELMKLIGRMKYRTSYGQNLLQHSVEVSNLAGIIASQLGLNVKFCRRAALLHDVGKVADKDLEGPHALLGMELAKKYGEHPLIVNAIGAHHEDVEMETAIAVIVQAADSISGARPGARRESLENYIKRLENLEAIANEWDGVERTYCIQAGREIRVIVEPDKINDTDADTMASGIAKKIETEMEYPGQIQVTVIRERRSLGVAK